MPSTTLKFSLLCSVFAAAMMSMTGCSSASSADLIKTYSGVLPATSTHGEYMVAVSQTFVKGADRVETRVTLDAVEDKTVPHDVVIVDERNDGVIDILTMRRKFNNSKSGFDRLWRTKNEKIFIPDPHMGPDYSPNSFTGEEVRFAEDLYREVIDRIMKPQK